MLDAAWLDGGLGRAAGAGDRLPGARRRHGGQRPRRAGVGPKTAAKWLQQFGTLDNLIAHADEARAGRRLKQALKDAIANGNLAKSKQLVALDTRRADDARLGRLEAAGLGRPAAARAVPRVRLPRVRRAGPQDAADERRGEERRGAGNGRGGLRGGRTDRATAAPIAQAAPKRTRQKADRSLFDQIDGVEEAPVAARPPPTAGGTMDYELVDTPESFDALPEEAEEAEAVRRSTSKRPASNPISDAIVGYAFCWKEGGVLPRRPRPGGRPNARPGRRCSRR